MSVDFVHRLVGRTRGNVPAVRPVVGPWSPASSEPLHAIEIEREIEREVGHEVEQPAVRPAEHDARPGRVTAQVAAPTALASRMAWEPGDQAHEPPRPLVPPVMVASREPSAQPAVAVRVRQDEPAAATTAETGVPARAHHAERTPPGRIGVTARAGTDARMNAQTGGAATSLVATSASDPRVSTHAAEAVPVIRVHIGRVDVRAAAPPAPVARRPAEPLPSVALGRYLDERERRR